MTLLRLLVVAVTNGVALLLMFTMTMVLCWLGVFACLFVCCKDTRERERVERKEKHVKTVKKIRDRNE